MLSLFEHCIFKNCYLFPTHVKSIQNVSRNDRYLKTRISKTVDLAKTVYNNYYTPFPIWEQWVELNGRKEE
jgi:hypothetical protein